MLSTTVVILSQLGSAYDLCLIIPVLLCRLKTLSEYVANYFTNRSA